MSSGFLIYADNEPKSVPARDLGDCRDNLRNSQSVFLIVFAWILSYRPIGQTLKCINSAFAGSYSYGIGYIIDKNFAVAICAGIDFINYKINDFLGNFVTYNSLNFYFWKQIATKINSIIFTFVASLYSISHDIGNHKTMCITFIENSF